MFTLLVTVSMVGGSSGCAEAFNGRDIFRLSVARVIAGRCVINRLGVTDYL